MIEQLHEWNSKVVGVYWYSKKSLNFWTKTAMLSNICLLEYIIDGLQRGNIMKLF